MNTKFVTDIIYTGIEDCKKYLRYIEFYQPMIAAGSIVAKISWTYSQQNQRRKDIRNIQKRLRIVQQIEQKTTAQRLTNPSSNSNLPSIDSLSRQERQARIEKLQKILKAKKHELDACKFSLLQILSLFFPDPGSNPWNSCYQIWNRVHGLKRPNPDAPTQLQTVANLAGGILAITGTAASLLRQVGAIDEKNFTSHVFTALALGVYMIEGALFTGKIIVPLKQWISGKLSRL